MATDPATTAAVDYLQRLGFVPGLLGGAATAAGLGARRLVRVAGVGQPIAKSRPTADREPYEPPTLPLLVGLAAADAPVAFLLEGNGQGVSVRLGTWATDLGDAALDARQRTLLAVLDGSYPAAEIVGAGVATPKLGHGAFGLGVPSPAALDPRDGALPVDRLLRSMTGSRWAALVLAVPVGVERLGADRNGVLNEMRAVAGAVQATGVPSPLAEHYVALLKARLDALADAHARGGWRTAVYLLGAGPDDAATLTGAWRAVFSGAKSNPEPVRTVRHPHVADLAARWALPDDPERPGPGGYRHPYAAQTLLSSAQLAAYVHLPALETTGFAVRPAPAFAVSRRPPQADRPALDVGEILAQRRPTGLPYRLELDQLTRHGFVAGLTGSGKTNTMMHLLSQAADAAVPFLVIEPAKTEYRELLGRKGVGERLRVFTIGREHVAPLRLNPFEVPNGIDVATHLDLLKAVFMGSFALWIPLPQILEQCLVELYTERGWDLSTGSHRRHGDAGSADVPTLAELVAAVERTVPALGYKAESTQEITASLTTRLNALRRGSRGLMLDVERSVPMGELLSAPTVVELEGLGDDADKAFVMGLLITRLYEYRRAEHAAALQATAGGGRPAPPSGRLSHLLVIEEAHRLLGAAKKTTDAWHADPQGAFVDTFSQILSEVRAYGQGVVVADQVPVRLAPDVIKNTNLKVVHRLVAGDDQEAMRTAMSMSREQAAQLAVLPPGRAAVFSEGDHTPVIVQVPRAKDRPDTTAIDDAAVAAAMLTWRTDPKVAGWFAGSVACTEVCRDTRSCRVARTLAEQPAARLLATRLFHTAVEHVDGLDAVWPDVQAFVAAHTRYGSDLRAAVHAFVIHALRELTDRRANQAGWPPDDVSRLDALVRAAVAERVGASGLWLGATASRVALVATAAALQRRTHDPFPLCGTICDDGRCPFRHALADVRLTPQHAGLSPDDLAQLPAEALIEIATQAAKDVTQTCAAAPTGADTLNAARWRAVACAAQQMRCSTNHPRREAEQVAEALTASGWPMTLDA